MEKARDPTKKKGPKSGDDERVSMDEFNALPEPERQSAARVQLSNLINDASQPKHMSGNACIKLCYFLEQCQKSSSPGLQNLAYSQQTCSGLFRFYVDWTEKNQHRSMRQVLELLATLISHNPDKDAAKKFKAEALEKIIEILTHQSAQPLVKPAFKVLECFLAKKTVNVAELLKAYERYSSDPHTSNVASHDSMSQWSSFVSDLFDWMVLPDTSPAAGKLLVTLFRELRNSSVENPDALKEHSQFWQQSILSGLEKHSESLENIKNYLFPPLFKIDRPGSVEFLRDLAQQNPIESIGSEDLESQASLLLSAMEVGKKLGLVDDPNDIIPTQKSSAKPRDFVALPSEVIGDLLTHSSSTVRSSAFSVLVLSLSSTKPFPPRSLDMIRENLYVLHADTDARFRNELFSNTKYMIERLRGAVAFLSRQWASLDRFEKEKASDSPPPLSSDPTTDAALGNNNRQSSQLIALLDYHKAFIDWYQSFLTHELVPTASYQRHVTSLRSLQLLIKSGLQTPHSRQPETKIYNSDTVWPYTKTLFTPGLVRLLLDLLLDPFEDVRALAADLLKLAPRDVLIRDSERTTRGTLETLIDRATMDFETTGRADLADGLAHAGSLADGLIETKVCHVEFINEQLDKLETMVSLAGDNLDTAVKGYPIHGSLAMLSRLWNSIDPCYLYPALIDQLLIQERMVAVCEKIWSAVRRILCNDSPEGHVVGGEEGAQDRDLESNLDSKSVLSYCFRACEQSSILAQAIIQKVKINNGLDASIPFLPFELFERLGNLAFEQLSTLRHRGAFSTVSSTFLLCCRLTQEHSVLTRGAILLRHWYQAALDCIFEQQSTTRRSAGIPALITGILSANSPELSFGIIMAKLQEIATQPVEIQDSENTQLPPVHATNCLKDIFTSATLSKKADSYVTPCLEIVSQNLRSHSWPIRNCALGLFKAITGCLIGTSESKSTTEAGWDGKSVRVSYDRYPGLGVLLSQLLGTSISEEAIISDGNTTSDSIMIPDDEAPPANTENGVFPALDFLRRVGPPANQYDEIFEKIKLHIASPIWAVREIAAKGITGFLVDRQKGQDSGTAMINLVKWGFAYDIKASHGVLRAIKYSIDRRLELKVPTAREDLASLLALMENRIQAYEFPGQPDTRYLVLAAFEEAMISLHNFDRNVSSQFDQDDVLTILNQLSASEMAILQASEPSAALYRKSLVEKQVLVSFDQSSIQSSLLLKALLAVIELDTDAATSLLECTTAECLKPSTPLNDSHNFSEMINFFCEASKLAITAAHYTAIFKGLSIIFSKVNMKAFNEDQKSFGQLLVKSWAIIKSLRVGKDGYSPVQTPACQSAQTILIGRLLGLQRACFERWNTIFANGKVLESRIEWFGRVVYSSSYMTEDVDERSTAVNALQAFFMIYNSSSLPHNPLLPSVLAVLRLLDDDDEDIREDAAKIVSAILRRSYNPLAGTAPFIKLLVDRFSTERDFQNIIHSRLLGLDPKEFKRVGEYASEPAAFEECLALALAQDDSLFAEEEPNLYADEVRKCRTWAAVLISTSGHSEFDAIQEDVAAWSLNGLYALTRYSAEHEDVPGGWASEAKVYALLSRVILCSYSCVKRCWLDGDITNPLCVRIEESLDRLYKVGMESFLHPLLGDQLLSALSSIRVEFDDKRAATGEGAIKSDHATSQAVEQILFALLK